MRIVQILDNQAHWIFEAEEMPKFPPDIEGNPIVLIDISDQPEIEEGWDYDEATETFRPPLEPEPEPEPEPETVSIEEEILYETKYQTLLLEMGGI